MYQCTVVNYFPVLVTGNTAIITLHRQLAYGTRYAVTIDPVRSSLMQTDFRAVRPGRGASTRSMLRPPSDGKIAVRPTQRRFLHRAGASIWCPSNNTSRDDRGEAGHYNEIDYRRRRQAFITVRGRP